jgi:DNA-binding ferritin-like protein
MHGMPHAQEQVAVVMGEQEEVRNPSAGLIKQLIMLASFLKEMETQSHLIHLNYEGENFLEVHRFLKGQYEMHLEQFDAVAEFVRSQDFWMPLCACGLKDALPCFQNVESYDGREMLTAYFKNLDDLTELAVQIEPSAQQVGAIDVANYMAELVAASSKAAWFIKAILRGC